MITAIDTNVLIDVLKNDATFGQSSSLALSRCIREGQIVVCDVVVAELSAVVVDEIQFDSVVRLLALRYTPMSEDAAKLAGRMWRKYRAAGGDRTRMVADFLIAAHAQCQCDRLLTRDRGFYRNHFSELSVIEPGS